MKFMLIYQHLCEQSMFLTRNNIEFELNNALTEELLTMYGALVGQIPRLHEEAM